MTKIDDMALFVQVVKAEGLAAAGRKLSLSPASMTARIHQLEKRYDTRLLTRNTRNIKLTDAGERFYVGCLRVLEEVSNAETMLQDSQQELRGRLHISATSDFGRQYVVPAIADFTNLHPNVSPHLSLSDGVANIIDEGIDLAIRLGNLPDSNLVSRSLLPNRRVLCASPQYIATHGEPQQPNDLLNHRCLVLERVGQALNEWYFDIDHKQIFVKVNPQLSCSDGEVIRLWAIQGRGIALKSLVDVKQNIDKGELVLVLDQFARGFNHSDGELIGLQAVYPSRQYQPHHVRAFIEFFIDWLQSNFVHR